MNEEFDEKAQTKIKSDIAPEDAKTEPDQTQEDIRGPAKSPEPLDLEAQRIPEEPQPEARSKAEPQTQPGATVPKLGVIFGRYSKREVKQFFKLVQLFKIFDIVFGFTAQTVVYSLVCFLNMATAALLFQMARTSAAMPAKFYAASCAVLFSSVIVMSLCFNDFLLRLEESSAYLLLAMGCFVWVLQTVVWLGQMCSIALNPSKFEAESRPQKAQMETSNLGSDSMISHNMSKLDGGQGDPNTLDITVPEKPISDSPQSSERQTRKIKRRNKDTN